MHYVITTTIGMAMIHIPDEADKVIESAMDGAKEIRERMKNEHNV